MSVSVCSNIIYIVEVGSTLFTICPLRVINSYLGAIFFQCFFYYNSIKSCNVAYFKDILSDRLFLTIDYVNVKDQIEYFFKS